MTVTENTVPEWEKSIDSTHEMMVAIIKPDGLPNKDAILERIVEEGFKLLQEKTFQLTLDQATDIYGSQNDYSSIKEFIEWVSSSDVCALLIEKENAVIDFTELLGSKNSSKAKKKKPRSLRALFGKDRFYNAVDGSESLDDARKEIAMIFGQSKKPTVDLTNETKGEIVNNPLPSPAASPVIENSLSVEADLDDVSHAQESAKPIASVESQQADPTTAENVQEKDKSNVHDAVEPEHAKPAHSEAPQPADPTFNTNTSSTSVEQNDLTIGEQASAARVENSHVAHIDPVEQPALKTEATPRTVEESEGLLVQEDQNPAEEPIESSKDLEHSIPEVEEQPQEKEEVIQEPNHSVEGKGGVSEPVQPNSQVQVEQTDDVNQSKREVQEVTESALEHVSQDETSTKAQEPVQQDTVPKSEIPAAQEAETEVPKQQEVKNEIETKVEEPVQLDSSAKVEESKQQQSVESEEHKSEQHQVAETKETKLEQPLVVETKETKLEQPQVTKAEEIKPEQHQSVKSKIKQLEQKNTETKEEPKQLNAEISAEVHVHEDKSVKKAENPVQPEDAHATEDLVIKENVDQPEKPEEPKEVDESEEVDEPKKTDEPKEASQSKETTEQKVDDKTKKTITKKPATGRDTTTSGTTNTSAGRSKNSSTKTEPSPKPSPVSSKNSDRKEIKATKAPSERSDTSGSRLRQPSVKTINKSPTSSGKPPLKKIERKPVANGVPKDVKTTSRISKPAAPPKETEEKKAAGAESGLKKKTVKTSKQLPRVALMSTPKPKPEDAEKEPKKTEVKKKRQSSTKDFLNRLTAPTLASKNKKTDATGDATTDAAPAPKAKRPVAATKTSKVSPNETIKKNQTEVIG